MPFGLKFGGGGFGGGGSNPFGRYSLPNVLGRLFHHDSGQGSPGAVTRQQFPTSTGGLNVGDIQGGGQAFNPTVNYGGNQGWQGPQQGSGTNYGIFNPVMGVGGGLSAAQGNNYGAFQPQFGSSPGAGSYSVGQNSGWGTADPMAAAGILGHFQGGDGLSELMRIRKQ
jgi:hypothetical protein